MRGLPILLAAAASFAEIGSAWSFQARNKGQGLSSLGSVFHQSPELISFGTGRPDADADTDTGVNVDVDALSRRSWLKRMANVGAVAIGASASSSLAASAAPPFAVIAEELGYFPVQNQEGQIVYVPKAVTRPSTEQAIRLAEKLRDQKVTMYGAYWCPHCARQKDVFGKEAWDVLLTSGRYVECSPKGFGFRGLCLDVDGYPTFRNPRRSINVSGEMSLDALATLVGYKGFDPSLEPFVPMIGACKIR